MNVTVIFLPGGQSPIGRVMAALEHSPEIAAGAHDTGRGPGDPQAGMRAYSVAPAPGGWDLVTFDDRIARAVLAGETECQVVTCRPAAAFWDGESEGHILTLAFDAPTHFRVRGLEHQLPDALHVFGNLASRWEALGWPAVELRQLKAIAVTPRVLRIARGPVIHGQPQRGFTGVVRYNLLPLPETLRAACWRLARFGEWRGVGRHTSYGMGRIRIIRPDEDWSPGPVQSVWRAA